MRLAPLCLIGLASLAGRALADTSDDYVRVVKPILAKHCVSCHGPERPKSGLRLDTAALAVEGGDGGPAVVAGKAKESPLYLAVIGEGDGERMPYKRPPLSAKEVEALRAWIDAGALAPKDEEPSVPPTHWSFVPPRRPEPPTVRDAGWVRNPIDRFILAPLERDKDRPVDRGRPRDAPPPRLPRPDRPAANARRGRRVPGRRVARRLWAGGGSLAGVAAFRRALGASLARPGPLCRLERVQHRRPSLDLEVSRLGHRRPQPRHAVRRVRGRAACRRPPAGGDPRPEGRHRLPSQHADQPGRGDRPRAVPDRVGHRPRRIPRAPRSSA